MRRRNFVSTLGAMSLIGIAGCTDDSDAEGSDEDTGESGSDANPGRYLTEIGFEKRDDASAHMYAIVSEEVAQINAIYGDGRELRSVTVPEGVSKVRIVAVDSWNDDLEYLLLDSEGDELESVTRDFEPRIELQSVQSEVDADDRQVNLSANITNTGNAPIVITPISAKGYLPARLTYQSRQPSGWDAESVDNASYRQRSHFRVILPDQTENIEVFRIEHSDFIYHVDTDSDGSKIVHTDIEWNESEYCQGETHDIELSFVDTLKEEYSLAVPVEYNGGIEMLRSRNVGFSTTREQYRCRSIEI